MTSTTPPDGIPASRDRLSRAAKVLPGLAAVLTACGILFLIVTGNTGPVAALAAFGSALFVGGAVTITINVIRK